MGGFIWSIPVIVGRRTGCDIMASKTNRKFACDMWRVCPYRNIFPLVWDWFSACTRSHTAVDEYDLVCNIVICFAAYSCQLSALTTLFQTRQSGGLETLKNDLGGVEGLAKKLNTDITNGIAGTSEDIETREYFYGKNRVDHNKPKTFWQLALEAASDATLIMLEIAATISLVLETSTADDEKIDTAWIEGTAIYVTVIIVVFVTAFNDMQKEKQFRELQAKDDALKECAVVRSGKTVVIPITNVVVGDIMEVEEGLVLPADGVLLRGKEMQCDESALTGESDPILKDTEVMPWMLSGTSVRKGSGRMLVIAVGLFSEEGIINRLVTKTGEEEVKRT